MENARAMAAPKRSTLLKNKQPEARQCYVSINVTVKEALSAKPRVFACHVQAVPMRVGRFAQRLTVCFVKDRI